MWICILLWFNLQENTWSVRVQINRLIILLGILMSYVSVAYADMSGFKQGPLPEDVMSSMKKYGVWKSDCPVPLERLRLLTIPYVNFEGEERLGEMVVLDAVAPKVLSLFHQLYEERFPIANMQRIDAYEGNDKASMEKNNTHAFNCRTIVGSKSFSIHAYGLAIDVNPLQNPVINIEQKKSTIEVLPSQGISYLNRKNERPGMVEPFIHHFKKHGFLIWGGVWDTPIDYHHFQTSRAIAEILAALPPEPAMAFFDLLIKRPDGASQLTVDTDVNVIVGRYHEHPESFHAAMDQFLAQ